MGHIVHICRNCYFFHKPEQNVLDKECEKLYNIEVKKRDNYIPRMILTLGSYIILF